MYITLHYVPGSTTYHRVEPSITSTNADPGKEKGGKGG